MKWERCEEINSRRAVQSIANQEQDLVRNIAQLKTKIEKLHLVKRILIF